MAYYLLIDRDRAGDACRRDVPDLVLEVRPDGAAHPARRRHAAAAAVAGMVTMPARVCCCSTSAARGGARAAGHVRRRRRSGTRGCCIARSRCRQATGRPRRDARKRGLASGHEPDQSRIRAHGHEPDAEARRARANATGIPGVRRIRGVLESLHDPRRRRRPALQLQDPRDREAAGVELAFARTPQEILDQARALKPPLVIFDLNSGKTDPIATIAAMKSDPDAGVDPDARVRVARAHRTPSPRRARPAPIR